MMSGKRLLYLLIRLLIGGFLLLSLVLATGWWLLTQKQTWWLPQLNQQLQGKRLQITQLSWQIPALDTLTLPQLTLNYQGNQLHFEQLQIRLQHPVTLPLLWQWYWQDDPLLAMGSSQWLLENIRAVSYQRARLLLTPQLLLPEDGNNALPLPVAAGVPDIQLNNTEVAFTNATSNSLRLRLPQVTLTRDGKFASQLQWQQQTQWQQLMAIRGDLQAQLATDSGAPQHAWHAQLFLTTDALQSAVAQLADDENAQALQTAYPWLQTDFLQKLPRIGGRLEADIQLGLQQGNSLMSVCWSAPQLWLPAVGRLNLTPQATAECPENSVSLTLNATDKQQQLTLAPMQLSLQTSAPQRQALIEWLASWQAVPELSDSQQTVESLLSQLSQVIQQPTTAPTAGLTLDIPEGASLDLTQHALTLPAVQLVPSLASASDWLTLNIKHLILAPATRPSIGLMPQDSDTLQHQLYQLLPKLPPLQLQADWQLQLNLPQGLRWQQADFSVRSQSTHASLAGKLQLKGDSAELSVSIAADARLQTQQLQIKTDKLEMNITSSDSRSTQPLQLKLTPQQLQLTWPELKQQLTALTAAADTLQASIGELKLTLPGLSQQQWHWREAKALTQLQALAFKQQLAFNAKAIHVSQQRQSKLGSRTETLLNLDNAALTEHWQWDGNHLSSQEQWQLDRLQFTSQHQLRPDLQSVDAAGYHLLGHWQMQAKLADIQALAAKNLVLSGDWQLHGNAHLNADIELQQRGTAFTLSGQFQPQLHDVMGSYRQLPFEGLQASSACRFVLDNASNQPTTAAVNCQRLALNMAAFNPGVVLDNVNLEGDISLTPELDMQKRQRASNWLLPGFNDADIQLSASANALGGQLSLPRFRLRLQQPSDAYLMLLGLDLHQLLQANPQQGIDASGLFDGVLPLAITNNQLSVSGGHLASRAPGGVIRIGNNPAVQQMRAGQPYLDFVFSTLEELQYQEIYSTFDMNTDGNATLNMMIKGHGKGVERPIELNYSHQENLLQLLRSLSIGDRLQTQLEASMQ